MKRLGIALLVVMFLAGTAGAANYQNTVVVENSNATYLTTILSQDAIPKGSVVIGFDVLPLDGTKTAEVNVALYDEIIGTCSGEIIGEAEGASGSTMGGKTVNRIIVNGVVVRQGPNTRVLIYKEV